MAGWGTIGFVGAGDSAGGGEGGGCGELPILHVDMDAFYVEVERKRDASLIGRPVIVGGAGRRGVVASASYEARASGVRSAMATAQARRLCPEAVVISSDFSSYIEASEAIADIFESVTPNVEPIALDEAFLDVSGAHRLFGTSPEIAWHLRRTVRSEVGLVCSVGVASTKTLAKLASVAAKPVVGDDGPQPGLGVCVVEAARQLEFLWAHPVEALWGVGPVTLGRLHDIDVFAVGDLAQVPLDRLVATVGAAHGAHLSELARGIDDRSVQPGGIPKSVSHEETFEFDVSDRSVLRSEIMRLSDAVAARLRAGGLAGRTVTVKVKHPDFSLRTRSATLDAPVQTPRLLAQTAQQLLAALDVSSGIRLLGVGVSNLAPSAGPAGGPSAGPNASPGTAPNAGEHSPLALVGEAAARGAPPAASAPPLQMQLALEVPGERDSTSGASSPHDPSASGSTDADAEADRKLAEALDSIRGRFGRTVIAHGAAALQEGSPGERRWGR